MPERPPFRLERFPPTFTAYFADRIRDWNLLFPAEQNYVERLFGLLNRTEAQELDSLFARLRALETKMGVNPRTWKAGEFTLEHVDFLNRSPFNAQWRAEISRIFSVIDPALDAEIEATGARRLVIVLSPPELPVGADRLWGRLAGHGRKVKLAPAESAAFLSTLLGSRLLDKTSDPYATWLIETGRMLAPYANQGLRLSYQDLESCRTRLMAEVRKILDSEAVVGPRELGERLKRMNAVTGDAKLDRDPLLTEFVRSVLLSGNGTLLVNNTFVEWAVSQVARRVRPLLTVAAFGLRNKVKPFSSLLIFEDQDETNIIPSQIDALGTYVDLEIFYQYVWQAFEKYAEYRGKTAYLFLCEGVDEMFLIAPGDFLAPAREPVAVPVLRQACRQWLTG